MPKLAERYTTKYGFQCLEKNVTRFEAEHAFQISPEPLVVEDINQYCDLDDLPKQKTIAFPK